MVPLLLWVDWTERVRSPSRSMTFKVLLPGPCLWMRHESCWPLRSKVKRLGTCPLSTSLLSSTLHSPRKLVFGVPSRRRTTSEVCALVFSESVPSGIVSRSVPSWKSPEVLEPLAEPPPELPLEVLLSPVVSSEQAAKSTRTSSAIAKNAAALNVFLSTFSMVSLSLVL